MKRCPGRSGLRSSRVQLEQNARVQDVERISNLVVDGRRGQVRLADSHFRCASYFLHLIARCGEALPVVGRCGRGFVGRSEPRRVSCLSSLSHWNPGKHDGDSLRLRPCCRLDQFWMSKAHHWDFPGGRSCSLQGRLSSCTCFGRCC